MNALESSFSIALDVYFGLNERDKAIFYLIRRYSGKVSPRLLELEKELLVKAKRQAAELFRTELEKRPPFLDLAMKEDSWVGWYLPVPLVFGAK